MAISRRHRKLLELIFAPVFKNKKLLIRLIIVQCLLHRILNASGQSLCWQVILQVIQAKSRIKSHWSISVSIVPELSWILRHPADIPRIACWQRNTPHWNCGQNPKELHIFPFHNTRQFHWIHPYCMHTSVNAQTKTKPKQEACMMMLIAFGHKSQSR